VVRMARKKEMHQRQRIPPLQCGGTTSCDS
jgi:hypothetical protein